MEAKGSFEIIGYKNPIPLAENIFSTTEIRSLDKPSGEIGRTQYPPRHYNFIFTEFELMHPIDSLLRYNFWELR